MSFEFKKLNKYPHMMPADFHIWNAFIDKYPKFFDRVDYDVKVGKGIEPLEHWDAQTILIAQNLTLCRIDALGWNGYQPTIVEVKPRARTTAIGQVETYFILYVTTFPNIQKPRKLIVTDLTTLDIHTVADKLNIRIIETELQP